MKENKYVSLSLLPPPHSAEPRCPCGKSTCGHRQNEGMKCREMPNHEGAGVGGAGRRRREGGGGVSDAA